MIREPRCGVFVCLVLAACGGSAPPDAPGAAVPAVETGVTSPDPATAPIEEPGASDSVGSGDELRVRPGVAEPATPLAERLFAVNEAEAVVAVIGVIDGDDRQIFGRIRAIEVDGDGNIFVLDEQSLRISWFGPDGVFRGAGGRAGGGPGEFRAPVGLAFDAQGRVEVLDMMYRRISTFVPTDSGLSLDRTRETAIHAFDFCRLGNRYFLLSPQDEGMLHEIAADGEVVRSFGGFETEVAEALRAHQETLHHQATRGRLHCVDHPPTILVVHEQTGMVRAFAPGGAVRWITRLADFRVRRFGPTPDGRGLRMNADPETGTAHTGVDVGLFGDGVIAVTLHEGSLANPQGVLEIRMLALDDGRELSRAPAEHVYVAARNGLAYGYRNHTWPRVVVVAMPR